MTALDQLDHLVFAVPDLAAGVAEVAERLGVEPSPGGPHPGLGTRNHLLSLGETSYIEVIGPDPDQAAPAAPRPFGLDSLTAPKLVTWAIGESDLEGRRERALAGGYDTGDIRPLSRQAPTGLLEWRLTLRREPAGDGLVPFLIDWGETPSPALSSTPGCSISGLRAEHPHPESVGAMLSALGVTLEVARGPEVVLVATLETPNGTVELR